MIERCLWSEGLPPAGPSARLPARTGVAIIGAGYTGLSAARTLARHGVEVTVLERHGVGWGASGRNGGFVLPGFKPEPESLIRRFGLPRAREMFAASLAAIEYLERLVADEGIDCDYARRGTVTLAGRPGHLRELERSGKVLREQFAHDTVLLGPDSLREEIETSHYHGGLLDPAAGSLHPARYCAGLAGAAIRAGARVVEGIAVERVRRSAGRTVLETSGGPVEADEVLVATNGYTGPAFPRLQHRVVPVGSYIVATARLGPLASRLIPRGRVLSDTWNLLHYFRLSGDGRMVFGGRASFTPASVARSARILTQAMRRVFPALAAAPVEFAWNGKVAFARDRLPHAGRMDGIHYALAYAGHGVAFSTWLGARMGDAIAGKAPVPELAGGLPAIPLYRGAPWFLPAVGGYYRLKDWLR